MQERERRTAERICRGYREKKTDKLEEMKRLDKKVKRPAEIFAYTFGIAGALVLGVGMCLAMGVIGNSLPLGVAIGIVGIAAVSANYPAYKKILSSRKRKYAPKILRLGDELLANG